jgi:hypothetical protein
LKTRTVLERTNSKSSCTLLARASNNLAYPIRPTRLEEEVPFENTYSLGKNKLEIKFYSAGEGQQQFSVPDPTDCVEEKAG